jgi:hypothetical protein
MLLLCLCMPATAGANQLLEEFSAAGASSLRIQLDDGSVEVTTYDGQRIRLEASARGVGASGIRFSVDRSEGVIVLRRVSEPWLAWLRSGPRVHVHALVPRGLRLEVETAGRIVTRDQGVERSFPAHSAATPALPGLAPGPLPGSPGALVGSPGALVGSPGALVGSPGAVAGSPGAVAGSPGALAGSPPSALSQATPEALAFP